MSRTCYRIGTSGENGLLSKAVRGEMDKLQTGYFNELIKSNFRFASCLPVISLENVRLPLKALGGNRH